jgi:hypothetical protein
MKTTSDDQDELMKRLQDCHVPEPSAAFRRQVLAAARQAWDATAVPVAKEVWWRSPGWQLAACVGLALLVMWGAKAINDVTLAPWTSSGSAQTMAATKRTQDDFERLVSEATDISSSPALVRGLRFRREHETAARGAEYQQKLQEMLRSLQGESPGIARPGYQRPDKLNPACAPRQGYWS